MKVSAKKSGITDETLQHENEIDELLEDSEADAEALAEDEIERGSASDTDSHVQSLQVQLKEAQDAKIRALADYQNLQRRSAADRAAWSKLATQDLVLSILEPLEHLTMASRELNDPGLSMVIKQLFDKLEEHGLTKVEALGKPFDAETMEAIEGSNPQGKKVAAVARNGYQLNGVLLQPAKVKIE